MTRDTMKMRNFDGAHSGSVTVGYNFPETSTTKDPEQFIYVAVNTSHGSTAMNRQTATELRDHLNDLLGDNTQLLEATFEPVDYAALDNHADALNRFVNALESTESFEFQMALNSFSDAVSDLKN